MSDWTFRGTAFTPTDVLLSRQANRLMQAISSTPETAAAAERQMDYLEQPPGLLRSPAFWLGGVCSIGVWTWLIGLLIA
jgi:hypothetical protein